MPIGAECRIDTDQWNESITRLKEVWDDQDFKTKQGKQLLALVQIGVFKDIVQHFKDEAGPSDGWQAWSKSYAKHMAAVGKGGNQILQDTGRLRNSMLPGTTSSNSGYRRVADGMLFFNNAQTSGGFPYAFAHNEGGPKLPKREFMWLSSSALEDIADQAARWLQSIWEAE